MRQIEISGKRGSQVEGDRGVTHAIRAMRQGTGVKVQIFGRGQGTRDQGR